MVDLLCGHPTVWDGKNWTLTLIWVRKIKYLWDTEELAYLLSNNHMWEREVKIKKMNRTWKTLKRFFIRRRQIGKWYKRSEKWKLERTWEKRIVSISKSMHPQINICTLDKKLWISLGYEYGYYSNRFSSI